MKKIIKCKEGLQLVGQEKEADFWEMGIDEIARIGATDMLKRALILEAERFCREHEDFRLSDGRAGIVLNGTHGERIIQSSIGPIPIRVPRINDRRNVRKNKKLKYSSIIVPPYIQKKRENRRPNSHTVLTWCFNK